MSKQSRQDPPQQPKEEGKKPGLIERAAGAIGGALGITHHEPDPKIYDVVGDSLRSQAAREAKAAAEEKKREEEAHEAEFRRTRYWPEDKPLPGQYVQQGVLPCPKCKRIRLDDLSQAVVCTSSPPKLKVKYFRCKACRYQWKLPVKKV